MRKIETWSNGMAVSLPNGVPVFPHFLIGVTAILRNGIRNFILSSTVQGLHNRNSVVFIYLFFAYLNGTCNPFFARATNYVSW